MCRTSASSEPNTCRPQVIFDEDKAVPFAPDLAVEMASPSQYRPGMAEKARRYLTAGTQLVWIVWPKRRHIDVWRSGDLQPSQTLKAGDTLEGGLCYRVSPIRSRTSSGRRPDSPAFPDTRRFLIWPQLQIPQLRRHCERGQYGTETPAGARGRDMLWVKNIL